MALKPDGRDWTVKEQIIEDKVTGLTLQFEVALNGEPRLRIYGDNLPFGDRDIHFNENGEAVRLLFRHRRPCPPAWLTSTDDL